MPSVNIVDLYSIWWYGWKALSLSFPNFLRIENWLNIKKVMGRYVWMCFVSNALTHIALNALEILMPSVNIVNMYSIWWYGWKALSLSFPKLFADWKLVEY